MTVHFRRPEPLFIEAGPQAVVLLHAYSGSSNDMGMIGRGLARAGYTVAAPIFTGHGTLDPRDVVTAGTPSAWLADAQRAVADLRDRGYHQIAVFGLSMGGLFATRLLELDADLVGGGTFASPVVQVGPTNVPASFLTLSKQVYARTTLSSSEQQTRLAWLAEHEPTQLRTLETFVKNEVVPNLGTITQPVFVAQGTGDEMIDPACGPAFAQALHEVNVTVNYHEYAQAGHVLTVNSAHKALQADVLTYLQDIFSH
ncbi:alpha/beta hydrolase [Furfurilactobacillus entadae]|uniref:alpha/beta hydrolase n=1 Tax=Furfurilactobacillus entadae TaxID=2922307 RepID=UPI0035E8BB83